MCHLVVRKLNVHSVLSAAFIVIKQFQHLPMFVSKQTGRAQVQVGKGHNKKEEVIIMGHPCWNVQMSHISLLFINPKSP